MVQPVSSRPCRPGAPSRSRTRWRQAPSRPPTPPASQTAAAHHLAEVHFLPLAARPEKELHAVRLLGLGVDELLLPDVADPLRHANLPVEDQRAGDALQLHASHRSAEN